MEFTLNFQKFAKYLSECLDGKNLTSDCKSSINANVITIFNKANTTKQTDGSEEVLDTFEFQNAQKDIDSYIDTYMTSINKYKDSDFAKKHTMFKDFDYYQSGNPKYSRCFSIIVNKEEMVGIHKKDGSVDIIRGNRTSNDIKREEYKSLEDLISAINNPNNNFGKLNYKGIGLSDVKLPRDAELNE